MAASVVVVGAHRLRRDLARASREVRQLKAINKAASEIVAAAAKARAPRKSGRLASSVRSAAATNKAGRVTYGRATGGAGGGATSLAYAGPIHWGWSARGIRAQPFVSEAAQATEPQWVALYEEHVQNIISSIEGA